MSDLSDLAEELTKDLPIAARKVIDKALANGWELNKPGLTIALRLSHPADDLALPVYISWTVGRTPKGAISFRFNSCSTAGLQPLKGPDLLEYLEDPTVAYTLAEEAEKAAQARMDNPPWDDKADEVTNLKSALGATVIGIEVERTPGGKGRHRETYEDIMRRARAKMGVPQSAPVVNAQGDQREASFAPKPRPLRVQLPSVPSSSQTSGSSSKA